MSRLAERVGPAASESAVWEALAEVPDPEIPAISIVDLGIVGRVESEPGRIAVELLPTFVGCPALEAIRGAVAERLAPLAEQVEVRISYDEPWTSDRISVAGKERLRRSGFAPPAPVGEQLVVLAQPVTCPYCGSRRTTLENAFGPTLCRAIHYCTACRQPFEAFKPV